MVQQAKYMQTQWQYPWVVTMLLIPMIAWAVENPQAVDKQFDMWIEKAQPSVVEVTAHKERVVWPRSLSGSDSSDRTAKPYTYLHRQVGTGWIHDRQGHVVTTARLVNGATLLEVRLVNGHLLKAVLVGKDIATNIAVIRMKTDEELSSMRQGDSTDIHADSAIMMMGFTYGQAPSLLFGQINGVEEMPGHPLCPFIRFQAPVQPGNTGGILLDSSGGVIGMMVAVLDPSRPSEEADPLRKMQLGGNATESAQSNASPEVGFALPIHFIEPIVDTLVEQGKIARGYLGVYVPVYESKPFGVTIHRVVPGSPAGKAQLRPGDCVLAVNGVSISNGSEFQRFVLNNPPGYELRLTLQRNGIQMERTVKLGEPPE